MKKSVGFFGCLVAAIIILITNAPVGNQESSYSSDNNSIIFTDFEIIVSDEDIITDIPDNTEDTDEDEIVYTYEELITSEDDYILEEETAYEAYNSSYLTDYEINLIALVTMAEAEGESEFGKRLVIDSILNRRDSDYFPDTISGVVYENNAFESMWNDRVDRCYVMDDICKLVNEECIERKNDDVIYFCTGNYICYGTPLFQEGNHYFSSL